MNVKEDLNSPLNEPFKAKLFPEHTKINFGGKKLALQTNIYYLHSSDKKLSTSAQLLLFLMNVMENFRINP